MDAKGFEFPSTAAVMDEIARVTPIYGGVSHKRLEAEGRLVFRPDVSNPLPTQVLYSDKEYSGLQWPCPTAESKGVEILHSVDSDHGRPSIRVPEFKRGKLDFDEGYPLVFTPGRVLLQSERDMEIVKGISNSIQREELIELHREDAEMFGVREGDLVEVQTNATHVRGKAVFHDGIQRGVVSATFLFGQLMVELQASQAPDPMSRVPGLEVASGRLIKLSN